MPTYCYSCDDEYFTNECEAASREEAVAIAEDELGLGEGYTFFVGVKEEVHPERKIDGYRIIEEIGDSLYDDVGDACDGWPPNDSSEDVSKLTKALQDAFSTWMAETDNTPKFYQVADVSSHRVESLNENDKESQ